LNSDKISSLISSTVSFIEITVTDLQS